MPCGVFCTGWPANSRVVHVWKAERFSTFRTSSSAKRRAACLADPNFHPLKPKRRITLRTEVGCSVHRKASSLAVQLVFRMLFML